VEESATRCLLDLVSRHRETDVARKNLHKLTNDLHSFLNLGCQIPSLSTEDPSGDTKLPIDDVSWDRGVRIKHMRFNIRELLLTSLVVDTK
jgi:hypothetical protein